MRQSHTYDPELHEVGSTARRGRCSHHGPGDGAGPCTGEAVVSFLDLQPTAIRVVTPLDPKVPRVRLLE